MYLRMTYHQLKNVVIETFKHLMQLPGIVPKTLPDYPGGIDPTHSSWPKDPKTNQPVIRFRWTYPKDNQWNRAHLEKICEYAMEHGAGLVPEAAADLKIINKVHMMDRVCIKFDYLRSCFNTHKAKLAEEEAAAQCLEAEQDSIEDPMVGDGEGLDKEIGGTADEKAKEKSTLRRADKNSRAQSVSGMLPRNNWSAHNAHNVVAVRGSMN